MQHALLTVKPRYSGAVVPDKRSPSFRVGSRGHRAYEVMALYWSVHRFERKWVLWRWNQYRLGIALQRASRDGPVVRPGNGTSVVCSVVVVIAEHEQALGEEMIDDEGVDLSTSRPAHSRELPLLHSVVVCMRWLMGKLGCVVLVRGKTRA